MSVEGTYTEQENTGLYTVKAGDNLSKIAKNLGFGSYQELVQLNAEKYPELISNPDRIFPGMELKTSKTTATETETSTTPIETNLNPNLIEQTYTVKAGDNLSDIAKRFNTDIDTLVALNQDTYRSLASNPDSINIGWTLSVSKPTILDLESLKAPSMVEAFNAQAAINETPQSMPQPARITNPETVPSSLPNIENSTSYAFNNPSGNERLAQIYEAAWQEIETGNVSSLVLPASQSSKTVIIIDLGHNTGGDPGAVSPHTDMSEVDLVDPVGAELADQLKTKGFDVIFTRSPGEELRQIASHGSEVGPKCLSPREARAEFANLATKYGGYENSIFISLHGDSEVSGTATGFTAYSASEANGNGKVDFGRSAIDRTSVELAESITNQMSNAGHKAGTNTMDATVITRFDSQNQNANGFHVASLIELGFLSNKGDASKLAQIAETPKEFVQSIVTGITSFHASQLQENQNYNLAMANIPD